MPWNWLRNPLASERDLLPYLSCWDILEDREWLPMVRDSLPRDPLAVLRATKEYERWLYACRLCSERSRDQTGQMQRWEDSSERCSSPQQPTPNSWNC